MSTLYPNISEQTDFLNDLKKDGNIFDTLYNSGFLPFTAWDELEKLYTVYTSGKLNKKKRDYITTGDYNDIAQVKRIHYMNASGITLALDVTIAARYGELNEVLFRMPKAFRKQEETKSIVSAIRRLQRLAKIANKQLKKRSDLYVFTLQGASEYVNKVISDNRSAMIDYAKTLDYRRFIVDINQYTQQRIVLESLGTPIKLLSIEVEHISHSSNITQKTKSMELVIFAQKEEDAVKLRNCAPVIEIQKAIDHYNECLDNYKQDTMVEILSA